MSAKFNDAMPGVHRGPSLPVVLLGMAVAAPWLWPFTDGPTANTWPLMFSWAVLAGGLVLVSGWPQAAPTVRAALPIGWVAAALLSAAIGLAQWFGVAPPLSVISPAQLAEAYGNLRQRNQFASLMGIGLLALLYMAGPRPRPWCLAAAALLACANAASASRTGLLQWILIALATLVPGVSPACRRIAAAAVIAYVAAALLLPEALLAWRGTDAANAFHRAAADMGCASRLVLWSNVAHLIGERPWTGWGAGELDYAHYATLYPGERFCAILDNAHNLPLHLAVELGLPAAVALCGVVVAGCLWARPWSETEPVRQLAWGVLAIIGLHSMLEYPLWYGPFQVVALLSVAILVWPRRDEASDGRAWPAGAAALVAAVAILGACGLAAWDYHRVSQLYKPGAQRAAAYREDTQAKVSHSLLFSGPLDFARLTTTGLTRDNAARMNALAQELLHYSPEPRVIEVLVESAVMLGKDDEAAFHMKRYRAAYPDDYARWMGAGGTRASQAR